MDIIYRLPGNPQPQYICRASYPIAPQKSDCDVTTTYTSPPYIGDIGSDWKIAVSNIITQSQGLDIQIDGTSIFADHVPASGSITIDVPNQFKNATTYQVAVYPAICHTYGLDYLCGTSGRENEMCSTTLTMTARGTPIPTPTPAPPTLTPLPDCNLFPCITPGYCSTSKCFTCPNCPGDPNKQQQQPVAQLKPICDQLDAQFKDKCWNCMAGGEKTWTAIGCLPNNFDTLIRNYILVIGISIAGGTSFLYFLYGAFLILTSAGNAEMIEEAKQIILSALSGLLLIIFSIFLLRVIGVDILKLPGFS